MSDIVAAARTLIGVRYRHQGRSVDGLDCLGLVVLVAQSCRHSKVDYRDYGRQAVDDTMVRLCSQHLESIAIEDIQPGDVLVMRFENQRHMAIVTDYPESLGMIHAYAGNRKVVEHRLDDAWKARIMRAYRFPETM